MLEVKKTRRSQIMTQRQKKNLDRRVKVKRPYLTDWTFWILHKSIYQRFISTS